VADGGSGEGEGSARTRRVALTRCSNRTRFSQTSS
jgi:hypothetical protein